MIICTKKLFSNYEYVSLEDIDHRDFAQNDSRGFLSRYRSNIIFDEIQRVPDLILYLQTQADTQKENGKIVITGSHNFLLMEQVIQSLASRVGITKLFPFSVDEIREKSKNLNELLYSAECIQIASRGFLHPVGIACGKIPQACVGLFDDHSFVVFSERRTYTFGHTLVPKSGN